MPKLTVETELIRVSQAEQVAFLKLINPKLKLEDACNIVGITPDVYREWIRKSPDAIPIMRQFLNEAQKLQMFEIATSMTQAINEAITDVLDQHTKPKDRLALLKFLTEYLEQLTRVHHAQPGIEDDAHKFLKQGPTLKPVKSRMASFEITPSDEGGVRVEISQYQDLIEGHLTDPEE